MTTKPLTITLTPILDGISVTVGNAKAWGLSRAAGRELAMRVHDLVRVLRQRRRSWRRRRIECRRITRRKRGRR
jgi:hypothetical protein